MLCLQAGLTGVAHIGPDKDYSAVIKSALESEGWTQGEGVGLGCQLDGCMDGAEPLQNTNQPQQNACEPPDR